MNNLQDAALNGLIDQARQSLRDGANINDCNDIGFAPLHYAVSKGHIEMARFLIDNGADPSIKSKGGLTPLHLAFIRRDQDMIHLLIKKGADVTIPDNAGNSLLGAAITCGYNDIAAYIAARLNNQLAPIEEGEREL
jgi:ankyrin repeat protein